MKHSRLIITLAFVLFIGLAFAQASGDYRSKATGTWSNFATWQRYNGSVWSDAVSGQVPDQNSSVWVQSGHIITLNQNQAVKDLHVAKGNSSTNTIYGRVRLETYSLDLYGKLRTYYAPVGTVPGTSTNLMANMLITSTGANGKLVVKGASSRVLTASTEWGDGSYTAPPAGQQNFNIEIAADTGVVITMNATIRAYSWNIVSGALNVANTVNVHADRNLDNVGDVTVGVNGILIANSSSSASSFVRRMNGKKGGVFTMNGLLKVMGTDTAIAMSTIYFNGTVEYAANGPQNFIKNGGDGAIVPNNYTNLVISGSGAKTMLFPITVNGDLGYVGTATLNKGAYALTEGPEFSISVTKVNTSPLFIDLPLYSTFDTDATISWTSGGSKTITAQVVYKPASVILPGTGLVMNLSGATLSGSHLKIRHGLGFIPQSIAYRLKNIADAWGSWHIVTTGLDATFAEFDVVAKATGDIQMAFPETVDDTLPIELSSFSAILTADYFVRLHWVTQSETGVSGFYILRSNSNGVSGAITVSPLIDATNSTEQHYYDFTDTEIFEPGTYYYWLSVQNLDGSTNYHGPTTVYYDNTAVNQGAPGIPIISGLNSVYPNPFNPSTTINYGLAKDTNAQFTIYNARGQIVKTMNEGQKAAGNWKLNWNGTDDNGNVCATGVYYIKMQAGNDSFVRKALLLK